MKNEISDSDEGGRLSGLVWYAVIRRMVLPLFYMISHMRGLVLLCSRISGLPSGYVLLPGILASAVARVLYYPGEAGDADLGYTPSRLLCHIGIRRLPRTKESQARCLKGGARTCRLPCNVTRRKGRAWALSVRSR